MMLLYYIVLHYVMLRDPPCQRARLYVLSPPATDFGDRVMLLYLCIMCVYTYVYMCIYIYIYMYLCMYIYIYMSTYVYIYKYIYVCIPLSLYIYICIYIYIYPRQAGAATLRNKYTVLRVVLSLLNVKLSFC